MRILKFLPVLALLATGAHAQNREVNIICSVQAEWCNMIQTVFAKTTGIKVNMSLKGSGEALAQLIAERANPKTDVWFGGTGDPHLQAAGGEGAHEHHGPGVLADVDEAARAGELRAELADIQIALRIGLRQRTVPVVQQRREQRHRRGHPAATLRQRQRRVLVAQQLAQQPVRLPHAILNPLLAHANAYRQGVDEHAQHPVRCRPALHPPEQHRAEHHLLGFQHHLCVLVSSEHDNAKQTDLQSHRNSYQY